MPDTIEQKKTRLQKLAEQKATIEAKLKAEKERIQRQGRKARTAENAKLRKAHNQDKYAYGGLCDIAGLLGTDRGAVLGVLLWASEALKDPDKLASFKKRGDAILTQRETARKN
jgi:Conjugal transfer protein TraD